MVKIVIKKDESIDQALRRFNREVAREGIIQELRRREFYERPSQARKREAQLKRKGRDKDQVYVPEVKPARDSKNQNSES
ncbi:MAG: 30S ribosomal protein S21 [Patescibacteria group bacterium]|nr:30S ribosomal protein S21 [Patescibacteria group bacterium]